MIAVAVSAVVVCVSALMLGQGALRVCGAESWSWVAAPIGLAVEMLVAITALHVPGRASTTAVVLGLLTVSSAVWILREPSMRPPLTGLLAAAPVAALTLVPFASVGHGGILGVSIDNDMAAHLRLAEGYRSASAAVVSGIPPDYPIGPHALAATLAQGLGLGVDGTFSGLSVAAAVLLAWTALAAFGRPDTLSRIAHPFVATVAGMPFLVAAYYGQGSFKEVIQAAFVLGAAGTLAVGIPRPKPLRWVPLAVLTAGTLSVYSVDGLPWIVGLIGGVVVVGAIRLKGPLRAVFASLRAEAAAVAVAVAALAISIAPQLPRLHSFITTDLSVAGTFIPANNLGNLAGPLPFWEAFGTWDNPDYRFPAIDQFATGMWTAFVLALAVVGMILSVRRRAWVLPIAAAASTAIWAVSDRAQSPYVAAKALVLLTPIVLLLAARPLVERRASAPRWWRLAAPLLAVVLVVKVVDASWQALRFSRVGPTDHLVELRSLRPLLDGRPTLFLGNDDFIVWELAGVPVAAPVINAQLIPSKPPKQWAAGDALDIDSVQASVINASDWVITTRDAAASEMPAQLALVKQTRDFALWRRTGTVASRDVLPEGNAGGAVLDCSSAIGQAIVHGGGQALIRPASIEAGLPSLIPGQRTMVDVPLAAGTYDVGLAYVSPQPVDVQILDHLTTVMPANLDRPGPRWPIGRVTVRPGAASVRVYAREHKTVLTPAGASVAAPSITATPIGGTRVVPIAQACGKYVDWYTTAALRPASTRPHSSKVARPPSPTRPASGSGSAAPRRG